MVVQRSLEAGSGVTDGSNFGIITSFLGDYLDFSPQGTIIIDPEFKELIPPLSEQEFKQLEENLKSEGVLSPLILWKGHNILLDGHNRYEICKKHNLRFKIVEIELENRDDVQLWLITNQLGRRNLLPEQMSYLRGLFYNLSKKQGERTDLTSRQSGEKSEDSEDENGEKLSDRLAKIYKVGSRTIERDAQFAEALNQLEKTLGGTIKQDIMARKVRLNRKTILDLADLSQENPSKARETLTMLTKSPKELKIAHHLQFTPGCLVRIRLSDNDKLHQRLGRAGKVTPHRIEVWHRDIETMQVKKYLLKFDQVEFVSLESQPNVKTLSDRLSRLREKPLDPFERDLLELLDRVTVLTPIEVEHLEIIEGRYWESDGEN